VGGGWQRGEGVDRRWRGVLVAQRRERERERNGAEW